MPTPPSGTVAASQPLLLGDPKAMIKNADMSEEMRQDSEDLLLRHWRHIICRRALRPVSRRSVARSTPPPGTASWGGTSYVTRDTEHFTSTWAKWPFCSNLVKSMDCGTHPVVHPKTRTAASTPNFRD